MLRHALEGLPMGLCAYYSKVGSTNDEALRLAESGGPDFSLVIADEQTAGRGRLNRRWFTPPGAALAFSLVLLPEAAWQESNGEAMGLILPRWTALGPLAVCQALEERYRLPAQIKWPNDVLVDLRKLAGVLAEAIWEGESLKAVVLGIGLNIASSSVPDPGDLLFPATCLADCLQAPVADPERLALLRTILEQILDWRRRISGVEFIQAWQTKLAFLDEWVWITPARSDASQSSLKAQILGVEADGRLRAKDETGAIRQFVSAEVHLRPFSAER